MDEERIIHPARYHAAVDARIKANRAKTGRAKWLAAHEDAQELYDWLNGSGQFADVSHVDGGCGYGDDGFEHREGCTCRIRQHPLCWYANGEFYQKLRKSLEEWGGLTDGQTQAVRNGLAKAKERLAEREVARAAEKAVIAAHSRHVGTVGERRVFDLTVERTLTFEGQYGDTHINLCKDADGNVVVYKGSNKWEKGPITVKATIKAHDVRDGIAQTILARPAAA